jgi:hypothetical protein
MALSRLPADHEEVSSRSLKEAAMGLEAGLGEALRTDYFMLRKEFTPAQRSASPWSASSSSRTAS